MITPAGTTPPVPGLSGPPMVLAEGLHKSFGRLGDCKLNGVTSETEGDTSD